MPMRYAVHGEIGDMPANMQAKLLRVLENGEIVRWDRTIRSRWMCG